MMVVGECVSSGADDDTEGRLSGTSTAIRII